MLLRRNTGRVRRQLSNLACVGVFAHHFPFRFAGKGAKASWPARANLESRGRKPLARVWAGMKPIALVLKSAIAMGKLSGGDDVQRIYIVDEPALVANGDAEFADENKLGTRDFKLLPVRCAYCKWTETATDHPLFQLLNAHNVSLNLHSIGVERVPIIYHKKRAVAVFG